MFVDTHIHLQDKQYAGDIKAVLVRAAAAGVSSVIIPGTNVQDSMRAVELAEFFSGSLCQVYAAVGVHPTETHTLDDTAVDVLRDLAQHDKVVAVGEIGLDYFWPKNRNRKWECAEPSTQRRALNKQLALANELSLPVIIHNREADADTLAALQVWHRSDPNNSGVLHSYSSGVSNLYQVIELGFKISIGGRITYKNADELREVAKHAPDGALLLETDGPYLTPVPHRGKRNEPQYINIIAQRMAKERDISLAMLAEMTTQNAISLFQFI